MTKYVPIVGGGKLESCEDCRKERGVMVSFPSLKESTLLGFLSKDLNAFQNAASLFSMNV